MDNSQVVAEGRIEKLKDIAEAIVNAFSCRIITHPSPGMIMIKHIDPIEKTPFYLGEAYVTQCEVEVDGKMGYGCVLGDDPERALYGAIIDAVAGNNMPVSEDISSGLDSEKASILEKWAEESRRIAKTKVNFDVKK